MEKRAMDGGPGAGMASEAQDIKRACDQCRVRKIRCDKESPCSNCRIAQRPCSSTGAGQKPKEARQRVLISTQYEKKIDQIEERLGGIETLLRDLAAAESARSIHESARSSATPFTPSAAGDASSATAYELEEPDAAFERNSTLAAHTAFASEFLETAVKRTTLRDLGPNMSGALSALQQIVNMQSQKPSTHELRFPHARPLPKGGLRELPMPPIQLVVSLLREVKDNPPSTFLLVIGFVQMTDFTEHCRRVCFATEDYSVATFIIATTGLFYLFLDKTTTTEEPARAAEYQRFADMCRDNLETALSSMCLFLPARKENIEALMLGASWAVEVAKPSLALQMTSKACELCQTLGYHRASTFKDGIGGHDARPVLFWMTYMLDKNLSLSLGRASRFQDYDITLPRNISSVDAGHMNDFKELFDTWITHAEIQGNIYERLYSPAALARPEAARVQAARLLDEEMKAMRAQNALAISRIRAQAVDLNDLVFSSITQSDEVSHLSSLTLIYRALPPVPGSGSMFNPECIEAAREAMRMHLICMQLLTDQFMTSSYIHWTILYAPFIPYVVLFCHIIETSDRGDIQRLADFVASLNGTSGMSEAIGKLHRLAQVLHDVAVLYVEAKQQSQEGQVILPIGNEVDMYLSALGLMPGDMSTEESTAEAGLASTVPAAGSPFQASTHLGDWFSGNRRMMGLLEDDLMNWSGVP